MRLLEGCTFCSMHTVAFHGGGLRAMTKTTYIQLCCLGKIMLGEQEERQAPGIM